MTSFNLLTETWLPVVTGDQAQPVRDISLHDALTRAHELRAIDAPSPLTTAALTRLLLAFLHRALAGPADVTAWDTLRQRGVLPLEPIDAYCARWADRFDLFSAQRPFYQVAALWSAEKARKPASQLTFARASERNRPTIFDHSTPSTTLAPAEAALGLVTTQAFSTGGLVSFDNVAHRVAKAAPLASVGVWTYAGPTLFDTLVANLVPYAFRPDDLPAWEINWPYEDPRERLPEGRCDWYTWQSRRMLLIPNTDGHVAQVVLMKGEQTPDKCNPWMADPLVMHANDGVALSPRGESAAASLGIALESLPLLQWYDDRRDVPLMITWAVTYQVKFIAWHAVRLVVPAMFLRDRARWLPVLADAVTLAHVLEPLLTGAPVVTAAGTRQSPMRLLTRFAPQRAGERDAAPLRYWTDIEQRYRRWLESIGADEHEPAAAAAAWSDIARNAVYRAFLGSVAQLPASAQRDEESAKLLAEFESCLASLSFP